MTSILPPVVARDPAWSVARWIGLALLPVLLFSASMWPPTTLNLLWNNVIPLLPAVFLLNPMIWRNVCPLATLNEVTGRRRERSVVPASRLPQLWGIGVVLLLVLVPARRFLFNEHPAPFVFTVLLVGLIALGAGAVIAQRGGFCNTLCPVLPVEKLYGQAPLVTVGSARCHACCQCTSAGCIDLAGRRSARQSVRWGDGVQWMWNPFGVFAAGFPGFVVGYYLTKNTGIDGAMPVYLTVIGWTTASALLVAATVGIFRLASTRVLPVLGAAAFALYYWFNAPGLAQAYRLPVPAPTVIRFAMLAMAAFWLGRAWRSHPVSRPVTVSR